MLQQVEWENLIGADTVLPQEIRILDVRASFSRRIATQAIPTGTVVI